MGPGTTVPDFGNFKTVQTACEAVGAALNLLLLAFTFRHRVGTRLSTVMLRSQCVLDTLVLIVDVLSHQYVLFDFPSAEINSLEWHLYCSVVFSHLVYYIVLVMSVYNLVALSAERCLCLTLPFWYKRHGKRILAVSFGAVAAAPFLAKVPHAVLKHRPVKLEVVSVNGTVLVSQCTPLGLSNRTDLLLELLYALLVWALPFVAMLALYSAILVAMRHSSTQSGQQEANKATSAAAKRLTIIIGVTSGLFVILLAPQTLLGVLYTTGDVLLMEPTFTVMALFPFLSSINSAVNPIVFFILLPNFRRFVFFCHCRRSE